MHPVDVAAQGIDLAVMGQQMVRVGPVPAWEGVGGETGVYQSQSRDHLGITQVRIKLVHLHRHQHPFINDGAGRDAGDIPELIHTGVADLMDGTLIDDIQLAVEGQLVAGSTRCQKQLAHHRFARLGGITKGGVIGRHIAPAQQLDPLFLQDPLHHMAGAVAVRSVGRGKDHGHPVAAGLGQFDSQRGADLAQKTIRHLQQNTCAVTGIGFAANRTAMIQVSQNGQGLPDDLMGGIPFDIGNKTNTTGIVLELGIVQPLFFRQSNSFHVATLTESEIPVTCRRS